MRENGPRQKIYKIDSWLLSSKNGTQMSMIRVKARKVGAGEKGIREVLEV